ncbi:MULTISPECIES: hypothetical protein [Bacteroides]|uniref:Outer membrane protein beta-barrel domain-containing protein n=1 Tax=Bacteroides oleiciplenus YIT 12058 TaxID=742727 RepID=K9E5A9_9BACE|nr:MULTISPECIES: hypothetical protein [Bacteroides]EKU92324.1 hypothetical protein HMPREF9447_00774 [Bacteroides oleiciplenus YIT 12058]
MKAIFIYIVFSMISCVTAFAQNEGHPIIDIPPVKQVQDLVPIPQKIPAKDSLSVIRDYPDSFDGNVLFTPHFINNAASLNHDLSQSYNFRHFTVMPFNQRMFQLGLGDIHNLGGTLIWKTNRRISFAGSVFLSKQYGYTFSSKHTSLGLGMAMNYQLNSQLALTLWGQYLLNRNKDPFIKSLDTQPKTGVGIRLEYNPNHNTKFSIDAGFRENSFDSSKLNYSVEGKAAIKF